MNLVPVEHDPFSAPPPQLIPVDHNPFAELSDTGASALSSLGRGLIKVPMAVGDTAQAAVTGATRLGGAAYTALGGELSPEQAQALTYPKMPWFSSQQLIDKAQDATGANLNYQPKTKSGEYASAAMSYLPAALSPTVGVKQAVMGGVAAQLGGDLTAQVTDSQKAKQLGEMLGGAGGYMAGPAALDASGSLAQKLSGKLGEDSGVPMNVAGFGIPKILDGKPAYDPMAGMQSMSANYGKAIEQSGKLYDSVSDIAAGQPVDAGKLADHIDNLISEISSNPADPANAALGKLKALRAKIDAGTPSTIAKASGEIPAQSVPEAEPFDLKDAVDLKKTLNESFRDNKWKQSGKGSAFADAGQHVDEIIKNASRTNPEFSQAYDAANRDWLNNVENKFRSDVTKPFFQPEDARNIDAVGPNGYANSIAPDTVERANMGPSKIKNATEMQAVADILDPEQAKSLAANVLKRQGGSGRAEALGRALTGAVKTPLHPFVGSRDFLTGLGDAIGGVSKTPEQAALIKTAKQIKRGK